MYNSDEMQFWKASFGALFDNSPDAIVYFDSEGKIRDINWQFRVIFGYTLEQVHGKYINEVIDPAGKFKDLAASSILEGQVVNVETKRSTMDGKEIPVILRGIPCIVNQTIIGGYAIYVDLTHVKDVKEQAIKFSHALEFSPSSVVITDQNGRIEYVNRRFSEMTGFQSAEVLGKNPRLLQSGKTSIELYRSLWNTIKMGISWRGVLQNMRKSGDLYWESMSISTIKNEFGEIAHFVAVKEDITKRKELEDSNYYLAYHDPLTGLPNRLSFIKRVATVIEQSERDGKKAAVLFIDLDRFKKVNDSLGHEIGDILLQAVSERLEEMIVWKCEVFRLGGDEFTVLVSDAEQAPIIANAIIEALAMPFTVINTQLFITVSIGISVYPNDGKEINLLLRNADTAMYAAKELGKNQFQFYKSNMNERAEELLILEGELRQVVEREELELYYQPQVDMTTGRVVGLEALVRWNHPRLQLVSPGDFIPLAEETGLIVSIGNWVLQQACKVNKILQEDHVLQVPIAVNISGKQFMQTEFVETVERALSESGLAPQYLDLEITESVAMNDIEWVIEVLQRLRDIGVAVSIDDFGTGYSSLNNFRQFPINKLKIDRSFINRLTYDKKDMAIVTSIINMAHHLELAVIAEGVETWEQHQMLSYCNCDAYQGYLFSKPLPLDKLVALLAEQKLIAVR